MSLRVLALYAVVIGLSIYAWKDWFKSLWLVPEPRTTNNEQRITLPN